MLRTNGSVLLNGSSVPASSAIYSNDSIETRSDAVARIEISGTTVDISAETVVQFEGDAIRLDHGRLSVNTSRAFRVYVGCLTVTPVKQDWTQYDVTDRDGTVTVAALKDDVNIDSRSPNAQSAKAPAKSERVSVRQGEQKSREEKCAAAYRPADADAKGPILNSPYIVGPAGGIIVGGTLCLLLCWNNQPLSPSCPAKGNCK
jgi:ferric-dicitrate binding protein FerR (iron transport regulator)